ncbi:DUF4932 domain-containing protein [Acidilutibacter cellobiosedens]|jgi:hypothetical protein|uniref:DUF4932 domain-containing protein n=1 Tax=Acidilutibacter cellobiosedens TaxID=2507161 RepID=A0A410QEU9_9FIRM|nr:DUF4932 domain-containing protein [Acidilutibacter cellobiosedens]QAT62368.1 DUF4932 domain-containing protein [Acidilutibacter cellobiosedens]
MKKKISSILIIILAILVFISGCEKEINVVKYEEGKVTVSVDSRIELISIIQTLAGVKHLTRLTFDYKDDVLDYFNEYKDHPAVKLFKEYDSKGFNYQRPMYFILCCNYNKGLLSFDEELYNKQDQLDFNIFSKDKNKIDNFIHQLNDFISASKFDNFFDSNKNRYAGYISNYEKIVNIVDAKKRLEQYYGVGQKSYNVILVPLILAGGYGINIKNEEKLNDIYCIMGPIDMKNNDLLFYIENLPKYIEYHEFSHSFVNPLFSKNKNKINENYKLSKLLEKVGGDMKRQDYGNIEGFLNELIVRSVVARLISKYEGEEDYKRVIEFEKEKGFIYIEEVCNSLENYEKNRDKYPTFESYYGEIIKCLSSIETE